MRRNRYVIQESDSVPERYDKDTSGKKKTLQTGSTSGFHFSVPLLPTHWFESFAMTRTSYILIRNRMPHAVSRALNRIVIFYQNQIELVFFCCLGAEPESSPKDTGSTCCKLKAPIQRNEMSPISCPAPRKGSQAQPSSLLVRTSFTRPPAVWKMTFSATVSTPSPVVWIESWVRKLLYLEVWCPPGQSLQVLQQP